MITPAILYKHLEKWVGSEQELYQHLLFFNEGVAATNCHQAIFIKKSGNSPHMETIEGKVWNPGTRIIPVDDVRQGYSTVESWLSQVVFPKIFNVKPNSDALLWSGKITSICFKDWKATLELIRRLSRKKSRYGSETPIILAREGNNLVVYVNKSPFCSAKFYLHTSVDVIKDESDVQWKGIFNVDFLLNFVDLLIDTSASEFILSIANNDNPLLLAENDDMWAVSTAYQKSDFLLGELEEFYNIATAPIQLSASNDNGGEDNGVLVSR